jgi:tRNA (cmo5U34)-methyltransferase
MYEKVAKMYKEKSSVEDIRKRFDADVERFSNLETGQSATVDAVLVLDLITKTAGQIAPHARQVLDIGCGAGNFTLKLLQVVPDLDVSLVDLSGPMLERASERIRPATQGKIEVFQADIRELELGEERYDLILAAQVFHHLRGDEDWRSVFAKCFRALRPGGALFISDLIDHAIPEVRTIMRQRWSEYLVNFRDEVYRDHVFAYIEREDTPRPLFYQLSLLSSVGFRIVDVLHKNVCFAAIYAVK